MWKLGVAKQLHVTEWKHLRTTLWKRQSQHSCLENEKKGVKVIYKIVGNHRFCTKKNNLWALMRRIESLKSVIFVFSFTFWRDKTILERNKHLIITIYLYFICSNFSPSTAIHIWMYIFPKDNHFSFSPIFVMSQFCESHSLTTQCMNSRWL